VHRSGMELDLKHVKLARNVVWIGSYSVI
jgi:hypothetical protein